MDNVNNPKHYCGSAIQPRDFAYSNNADVTQFNATRYIHRAGKKDSKLQDLEKTLNYLDYELDLIEKPLKQINVDDYLNGTDLNENLKCAIRALYNNKLTKRERLKIAKFSVLREINDIKERMEDE